ncbi:MAG TPA: methylmalonyl Co-A mutase-associated GTPase MeaB, partial [Tepidisphaeraceae bacterium]|nr:methylmalonyl Co-A mutase-associated GTPase MeaB [Tepidisphaeraceae bacterium]
MTVLAEKILAGDLRSLARAATQIENRSHAAQSLLKELFPHTGRAGIIGITGAPGAGKSTFTDRLVHELRREEKSVGVIAVDPTSPYTGGAILGDRIRMLSHHADASVFIRSMATRGHLGGLAAATTDLALLLDAAGKDFVLIETVGVGQDEVEIAKLADVTVVVLVPGMGDDVQAIKAGILEIADVFVINKADQSGGADRLEREILALQSLSLRHDNWVPPIVRTVASEGQGIPEALAAIRSYLARAEAKDRAVANWTLRLREMLRERLLEQFANIDFQAAAVEVAAHRSDPYTITDGWIQSTKAGKFEIDHLGIAVRSLDAALEFYRDQLGCAASPRETVQQEKVNVVMLPAGESRIELLEASEPDSVIAKFIEKRGEGLHHIALKVPDLAGTVQRLKEKGVRLLNEPRAGAGGHIYVFVHPSSSGGVLLELIQE